MDVLPSDGFKALIHHMPKMDPSVEHDGLAIIRWVFNMLLESSNKTWMQSIKNRKLKQSIYRKSEFFFFIVWRLQIKALIHHKPKREFQLNMMNLP